VRAASPVRKRQHALVAQMPIAPGNLVRLAVASGALIGAALLAITIMKPLFQRIPVATISALPSPVRSDIDIEDPPISAKARSKSVSPAIVENPKDSTSSVSIGDASARPSEAPHAATPTDTQKWKKHLYLNDGFEVEFSGFVQILEQPIPEEL